MLSYIFEGVEIRNMKRNVLLYLHASEDEVKRPSRHSMKEKQGKEHIVYFISRTWIFITVKTVRR
jgi:hypothetical protein